MCIQQNNIVQIKFNWLSLPFTANFIIKAVFGVSRVINEKNLSINGPKLMALRLECQKIFCILKNFPFENTAMPIINS